ncbi:hypothetical protein AB4144_13685, partial [Rhizobiaceae sp. 2RAB30]
MMEPGPRHETHAVHRGVVHAGYGDTKDDSAQRQPHAALPRQKDADPAISGADGDQDCQDHHRNPVFD